MHAARSISLAMCAAAAIACARPDEVRWAVDFDGVARETGTRLLVRVRGSCDRASVVHRVFVAERSTDQAAPAERYALEVTAFDRQCHRYAVGCTDVDPKTAREVRVVLSAIAREPCEDDVCECTPLDAGVPAEDAETGGWWLPDADGDGYPAPVEPVASATPLPGYVRRRSDGAVDCDDSAPWMYPGAREWCDGVDNDCDGENDLTEGACPAQCVGAIRRVGDNSINYMVCLREARYADAQALCASVGYAGVIVRTGVEQAQIDATFPTLAPAGRFVWLAGTDLAREDEWRWADGEVFFRDRQAIPGVYSNLREPQPNGGLKENCLAEARDLDTWVDAPCERAFALPACERRP